MTKVISAQQTVSNIEAILNILANVPIQLENLARGLSDEQLHQSLGVGERSFTENLAHLLHCEDRSSEAIYLALLADEPLILDIHPERHLGKLLRLDQFPFSELLAYLKFRRSVLLRVLQSLEEEQWSRTIQETGKKRRESVYWRARGIALHELEHVSDIETKLNR